MDDTDESVAVYLTGLLLCRSPEVQDRISELLLESGKQWGTKQPARAGDMRAELDRLRPVVEAVREWKRHQPLCHRDGESDWMCVECYNRIHDALEKSDG